MSHRIDMIQLVEGDARRLTAFRRRDAQLDAEQHRFAASLGAGIGMQFAHLARTAREAGDLAVGAQPRVVCASSARLAGRASL